MPIIANSVDVWVFNSGAFPAADATGSYSCVVVLWDMSFVISRTSGTVVAVVVNVCLYLVFTLEFPKRNYDKFYVS